MGHLKAIYVCKGGGGVGQKFNQTNPKKFKCLGDCQREGGVQALNWLTHNYIDFIKLSKLSGQVLPSARAYSICCGIKQQGE